MRKWLSILILGMLLVFPSLASAQSEITLGSVNVQLWPEYDQPSMLVIFDFAVSKNTALPAQVTFRLPKDANVIAVAFEDNGTLVNANSAPTTQKGEWQILTIAVDAVTTYHFEYYEPIRFNGRARQFSYLWPADYAVEAFNIKAQEPMDTVSLTSEPVLEKTQENGANFYSLKPVNLAAGEQFTLNLQYEKSSDALTVPASPVQTAPIDEPTSGRIPLNSYLPYILVGVGAVLIVGGLLYYFLSGRERGQKPRRRNRAPSDSESNTTSVAHCHQCGTRAKPSDRFCRVCGTRLRQDG
jgi:hypothetical protein